MQRSRREKTSIEHKHSGGARANVTLESAYVYLFCRSRARSLTPDRSASIDLPSSPEIPFFGAIEVLGPLELPSQLGGSWLYIFDV